MTDSNFQELMRQVDPDGSGEISYQEFMEKFGSEIAGGADTGGLSKNIQLKDDPGRMGLVLWDE